MKPIVMDISRLMERAHCPTPTGIDRYELHYAHWLNERRKRAAMTNALGAPQASWFVETGHHGAVSVATERADKLVSTLARRWAASEVSTSQAALLDRIFAAIDGKIQWQATEAKPGEAHTRKLRKIAHVVANHFAQGRTLPGNASFVHVSHSRLERTSAFSWLEQTGRNGVFYVHDLIPLSHPEFVRPEEPERHRRRMATVLKHASLVLCNSQVTARALRTFAQECNSALPSIAVLPPGVEQCFLSPPDDIARTQIPYFVTIGTIEPRKNHILLLRLWQYLAERDGPRAPRLVIVGKRGWENSHILAMLERCPALPGLVIEVPGLEDAALARLVAGAAALLAPSFTEGYGMPIAEAIALGTPVVASNISAHREAAGGHPAIFLDPLDGLSWKAALDMIAASPRHRTRPGRPGGWDTHFDDLEALIEADLSARRYAAQRAPRRVETISPSAILQ
ncbi:MULTISPECIES: glycosyltransferase family 1 protein [unclassified Rhizobium]|uniref:glycosyltransferase family 4 protein n=1 Tax=unclassified Rhizobium TaxID=2613769 RepID=UPI001612A3EF|nr:MULTISPECIES: glycosyltransferase family 1 protein [unclassified Rhizobium]MBB3285654.1 glycosyltransferase involved in cell wall biosynthesis [Rhizobium sp. BK252]MBB3400394.1 glycosyltransferase involved in cell wall biosynthesis [Rhizobium sp. BK289]MBB3412973.1 glycosyltransferase involved in cell wall biosynthesis [Rhizobium sp. BK284]MBB3480860.1 glycosyltransferase involved in cell wall biosynthesis [Rhizobium sp. BK347]